MSRATLRLLEGSKNQISAASGVAYSRKGHAITLLNWTEVGPKSWGEPLSWHKFLWTQFPLFIKAFSYLLMFPAQTQNDSGAKAEIVLAVIRAVWKFGHEVFGLQWTDRESM